MELLATKQTQVWNDIYSLIEEKKSSSYDKTVDLIGDLNELALFCRDSSSFRKHINQIQHAYSNRSALLRRMRNLKVIE